MEDERFQLVFGRREKAERFRRCCRHGEDDGAFEGKGEADILRAIYKEAERGRKAGTLTDSDLDNFYAALYPMLDSAKRKKLEQVINKLKKM